jgi:hypothetical protein
MHKIMVEYSSCFEMSLGEDVHVCLHTLTLLKLILALYLSQVLNASQATCSYLGKFWYPSFIGSFEVSQ